MITTSENFRSTSFAPITNHRIRSCAFRHGHNDHHYYYHYQSFPNSAMGSSSSLSASLSPLSLSMTLSSSISMASQSTEIDTRMFLLPDNPLLSPLVVVILALVLLVSAQTFINNMLEGDQGLGAFLKDGSGYNRSGYRPSNGKNTENNNADNSDPLPWLKLPRLDFVEVAGQREEQQAEEAAAAQAFKQEEQDRVYRELDRLKRELNTELETVRNKRKLERIFNDGESSEEEEGISVGDDMEKAKKIQSKLEGLMRAYGIKYEAD